MRQCKNCDTTVCVCAFYVCYCCREYPNLVTKIRISTNKSSVVLHMQFEAKSHKYKPHMRFTYNKQQQHQRMLLFRSQCCNVKVKRKNFSCVQLESSSINRMIRASNQFWQTKNCSKNIEVVWTTSRKRHTNLQRHFFTDVLINSVHSNQPRCCDTQARLQLFVR